MWIGAAIDEFKVGRTVVYRCSPTDRIKQVRVGNSGVSQPYAESGGGFGTILQIDPSPSAPKMGWRPHESMGETLAVRH